MKLAEWASLIGAIGGAAGGVALWLQLQRTKVALKVVPYISRRDKDRENIPENYRHFPQGQIIKLLGESEKERIDYEVCLAVRVINFSVFDISISDIGYYNGNDLFAQRVSMGFDAMLLSAPEGMNASTKRFPGPYRLKSREAMTVGFGWLQSPRTIWSDYKYAYARTACGVITKEYAQDVIAYYHLWNEDCKNANT